MLICDRYDRWLVVQLLSAGLEAFRTRSSTLVRLAPRACWPNDVPLAREVGGRRCCWQATCRAVGVSDTGSGHRRAVDRMKTGAFLTSGRTGG